MIRELGILDDDLAAYHARFGVATRPDQHGEVPRSTGPERSEADEATALAKFPGATIQKTTLDGENGSVVYSGALIDADKAAQRQN